MIDLQGYLWLATDSKSCPIQQDTNLLQVVAEIVKIEISIVLHDVLSSTYEGECGLVQEASKVKEWVISQGHQVL